MPGPMMAVLDDDPRGIKSPGSTRVSADMCPMVMLMVWLAKSAGMGRINCINQTIKYCALSHAPHTVTNAITYIPQPCFLFSVVKDASTASVPSDFPITQ